MGDYLVVLRARGRADTRYPVFISRSRAWSGRVRLLTPAEIGEGFVHVPAGPYVLGGDPALPGWGLPGQIAESEDFCIGVHPVTMGEYVEFLNDLVATDPAKAALHSPKKDVGGSTYLEVDASGRFSLPPRDLLGEEMHPRRPCVSITWHSAVAYAEWRSARDGRAYRLPTEFEWEKAARGVDGRAFPWGDRFDASLCNSGESNPGRPRPLPVDSYETDVSVYGVRGMAGNARDWTATLVTLGSRRDRDGVERHPRRRGRVRGLDGVQPHEPRGVPLRDPGLLPQPGDQLPAGVHAGARRRGRPMTFQPWTDAQLAAMRGVGDPLADAAVAALYEEAGRRPRGPEGDERLPLRPHVRGPVHARESSRARARLRGEERGAAPVGAIRRSSTPARSSSTTTASARRCCSSARACPSAT